MTAWQPHHNVLATVAASLVLWSGCVNNAAAPLKNASPNFVGPGCPTWVETFKAAGFPSVAQAAGATEGHLVVEFTLGTDGRVIEPRVIQSSNATFDAPTLAVAKQVRCVGGERDLRVRFAVEYKLL